MNNAPEAPWGVMRSRVQDENRPWLVYNGRTPLGEEDRFETFEEALKVAFSNATDELTWEEIAARTLLHYAKNLVARPWSVFMEHDAAELIRELV